MCVIILKPVGHKLPTKKELRRAYNYNPDGCGFASKTLNYKSMDFEDFYRHLKEVPQDESCIIHFRIATHGSVCLRNCHPFYDKKTNTFFAHNGVLPYRPENDITDSEYVFRKKLVNALKVYDIYSVEFKQYVNSLIGTSKFAFLQDGNIKAFGHFEQYGGCYYSNLRHLNIPVYWYAS